MISVDREMPLAQNWHLSLNAKRRLDFYTDEFAFDPSPSGFIVTVVSTLSKNFRSISKKSTLNAWNMTEKLRTVEYRDDCRNAIIKFYLWLITPTDQLSQGKTWNAISLICSLQQWVPARLRKWLFSSKLQHHLFYKLKRFLLIDAIFFMS